MNAAWPLALQGLLQAGPCVMVTVAAIKGSAPRELGARMLVTESGFHGSIGGGNLEMRALATARDLLAEGADQVQLSDRMGLGPALNQCCGGSVTLLFEYCHSPGTPWLSGAATALTRGDPGSLLSAIDSPHVSKWLMIGESAPDIPADAAAALNGASDLDKGPVTLDTPTGKYLLERLQPHSLSLYLFGAGHVGKAVVRALAPLPFGIEWVDSRQHEFSSEPGAHVRQHLMADPVAAVKDARPGSLFLVMTHSHQLDEDICHAVLSRGDFHWLGLIGSRTKALRFRHRLADRGIPEPLLERLECPVGLAGVKGKRPATIAVSIAAQLLAEQVPPGWK